MDNAFVDGESSLNTHISNPNAVLHVISKRLAHPTNVDIYCLLFNAQGQVVEHLSHHAASQDGAIVQEPRNQYGHDQKYVLTLANIHQGIDVIGFILSHSEDIIADQNRPLEESHVLCLLHTTAVDEILTHVQGTVLCEDHYVPQDKGLFRNATMICKLYRDSRHRSHWIFNPICEGMKCASHCIVGLTRCAQLHLVDIIQDIDIPNVTTLHSIQGICSALSSVEFLAFENMFPADGFNKQEFARCLCEGMVHSRPELRSEKRIVSLLSLLYEMFDQIDINGDCQVDWEEFTSFCVALGMISTKQSKLSDSGNGGVEYVYKQHTSHGNKQFPYHITRIKCFEGVRKVAVLEYMSPAISIFEFDGTFLHEMTGVAKTSAMKEGLYILDLDYVPGKNSYIVSSSDRVITIWSVVSAVKGQYVLSGKIINHDMMMVVKWCPMLKLCMTSCVKHTSLWNIDRCKIECKLAFHTDLVTDIVEIPATRMFATCSYDHKVAVWEADRMKVLFELQGHTQAILRMNASGNVLVSCGFEHHARVWSIATRKHLVMLTGHHHPLLDAKLIRHHSTSLICVTGDSSGHFKVWDISRCIVDASRDAAIVLHTYTISVVGSMSPVFHSFDVVAERKRNAELLDIWTGNFQIVRLVPEMVASLHSPLQYVLYNQVSHSFTAFVAGRITVWSGKSGTIIQEPITITQAEVCGLCYDLPRQRKLFVATTDGVISMYNPITGVLMDDAKVHDGEILTMIYCERTNCIISNGGDDTLSICCDVQGQGRLDPLRTIQSVHNNHMTACAYSSEQGLIATGDSSGHIRVHDFQRLSLVFRCEGHKGEVSALTFHKDCCVLFAGDTAGEILVWQVLNVSNLSRCIMRLSYSIADPNCSTFLTQAPDGTKIPACGINSLCVTEDTDHSFASIIAGDDLGNVHCWPLSVIRQHTRGLAKIYFEPLPDSMIAYARGGYNPNLRITRRQSVMSTAPPTQNEPTKKVPRRDPRQQGGGRMSSPRVQETISWKAHQSKVIQVQPLQFPGFFFSYDDYGVRLWDVQGECLGSLQRKFEEPNETMQWNYRSSVLIVDHSAEMKEMANSILEKLARKTEVVFGEPGDSTDAMEGLEDQDITGYLAEKEDHTPRTLRRHKSLANVMERTKAAKFEDPGLSPAMEHIRVKAQQHQAFSRQSLNCGVKEGVFTQDESYALEHVGRDPIVRRNYETILFPPLLLTTQEIKKSYSKEFIKKQDDQIEDLPILRTCDHYAEEVATMRMKKKRSQRDRMSSVDIEPSDFLISHLGKPKVKKSPKKKSPQKKIQFSLDSYVTTSSHHLPTLAPSPCTPPRIKREFVRSISTPTLNSGKYLEDNSDDSEENNENESPDHDASTHKEVTKAVKDNINRKITFCENMWNDKKLHKVSDSRDKPWRVTKQMDWMNSGKNPFGPHYSVREVLEFGETLLRFDKDLSGDIDQGEWMKIMTAFVPKTHESDVAVANELFATVDANEDGLISLNELLRIVFIQATREQLSQMEELIRRSSHGDSTDPQVPIESAPLPNTEGQSQSDK